MSIQNRIKGNDKDRYPPIDLHVTVLNNNISGIEEGEKLNVEELAKCYPLDDIMSIGTLHVIRESGIEKSKSSNSCKILGFGGYADTNGLKLFPKNGQTARKIPGIEAVFKTIFERIIGIELRIIFDVSLILTAITETVMIDLIKSSIPEEERDSKSVTIEKGTLEEYISTCENDWMILFDDTALNKWFSEPGDIIPIDKDNRDFDKNLPNPIFRPKDHLKAFESILSIGSLGQTRSISFKKKAAIYKFLDSYLIRILCNLSVKCIEQFIIRNTKYNSDDCQKAFQDNSNSLSSIKQAIRNNRKRTVTKEDAVNIINSTPSIKEIIEDAKIRVESYISNQLDSEISRVVRGYTSNSFNKKGTFSSTCMNLYMCLCPDRPNQLTVVKVYANGTLHITGPAGSTEYDGNIIAEKIAKTLTKMLEDQTMPIIIAEDNSPIERKTTKISADKCIVQLMNGAMALPIRINKNKCAEVLRNADFDVIDPDGPLKLRLYWNRKQARKGKCGCIAENSKSKKGICIENGGGKGHGNGFGDCNAATIIITSGSNSEDDGNSKLTLQGSQSFLQLSELLQEMYQILIMNNRDFIVRQDIDSPMITNAKSKTLPDDLDSLPALDPQVLLKLKARKKISFA
tara:strand:+ start:986 stop:2872 length:1887 start_codon:yes stop_codon:yes gene_type:complete